MGALILVVAFLVTAIAGRSVASHAGADAPSVQSDQPEAPVKDAA